jgi:hypothetical protein
MLNDQSREEAPKEAEGRKGQGESEEVAVSAVISKGGEMIKLGRGNIRIGWGTVDYSNKWRLSFCFYGTILNVDIPLPIGRCGIRGITINRHKFGRT